MIFRILLGLVVLAPLPFAAVYQWSWGLMAALVGGLLIGWSASLLRGNERPALGLRSTWPYVLLFSLAVGWAAAQSFPFTPEDWHHPLWRSAGAVLETDVAGVVSLDPFATRSALLRLLTYCGLFWLSLQYCRRPERARTAMYVLTIAGLGYALYGLAVEFAGAKMVLWYDKFTYRDDLTSTFWNRNSYATYAGLTLVCASGLLLKIISEGLAAPRGRRERLRQLIEDIAARGWILLLAWMAIMTALLLTHSRAGFASTVLGLLVLCVALGFTRAVKARYAVVLGALSLLAGAVFFGLSGDVTDERLAATSFEREERSHVYELTVDAIETAPILGTGYGTFEDVFRFYRDQGIRGNYDKTHSTYLENTLALGLPGAFALFGAIGGLFLLTLKGLRRRRRDAVYPCIGVAATVLVAAHSLVDFSLQIPAVAITYSFIMGAACAQSWSSRRPSDPW